MPCEVYAKISYWPDVTLMNQAVCLDHLWCTFAVLPWMCPMMLTFMSLIEKCCAESLVIPLEILAIILVFFLNSFMQGVNASGFQAFFMGADLATGVMHFYVTLIANSGLLVYYFLL